MEQVEGMAILLIVIIAFIIYAMTDNNDKLNLT